MVVSWEFLRLRKIIVGGTHQFLQFKISRSLELEFVKFGAELAAFLIRNGGFWLTEKNFKMENQIKFRGDFCSTLKRRYLKIGTKIANKMVLNEILKVAEN